MSSYGAVSWAQEVVRSFGRWDDLPEMSGRPVWVVPLSQVELARRTGVSGSNVAHYLNQLGDVVLRRRGGVVLDVPGLAALVVEAERERAELPQRTAEVAWVLARRLGRATAEGTTLFSVRHPDRPPSLAEMADATGLSAGTVTAHLRRLEAAGRLVRQGRFWIMPPSLRNFTRTDRDPQVAAVLSEVLQGLWHTAGFLADLQERSEALQQVAREPDVAAFTARIELLYDRAVDLLSECGIDPMSGRPERAHDDG